MPSSRIKRNSKKRNHKRKVNKSVHRKYSGVVAGQAQAAQPARAAALRAEPGRLQSARALVNARAAGLAKGVTVTQSNAKIVTATARAQQQSLPATAQAQTTSHLPATPAPPRIIPAMHGVKKTMRRRTRKTTMRKAKKSMRRY